ncbi:sensor histidine kinase [Staphylococcus coagulans]|uniref:sensor histidine kinase n=1 Tax=Staphylococcus coagulans TaxID=74706 RepID=UPI001BECC09A|nr:sensor histidine kinase [Staphylococcus coagulans]MBT2814621.1 sensor histidine kinase [Staphylococcus coagulans]MBT2816863.1 sensor histidine kinase [Staphylococcus coagulans]MBT2837502.1 sensor histidine kinase [Staphylococcus coagulans]MBT2842030.1 sensor histidine kinase [Staphylococcus coagulans]MBT2848771.1 sensor histidine kinase [Staphylococcus coagulans]
MKKLDLDAGHLSSLIYLLFPFLALFLNRNQGNTLFLIVVFIIFSIVYTTLIIGHRALKPWTSYFLLVLHYLGIIYFVYAINPTSSLFLFYSVFALPLTFRVKLWSKEYFTFLATMLLCLIVTFLYYSEPFYIVMLIIYYFVMNLIMFSNFKRVTEHAYQSEINAQNEHINVLIADQERNRIGQDLHDTLGHVFASLSLKSELAIKLIDRDLEQAKAEMIEVNQISKEALTQIREIIHNLKTRSFVEEVTALETLLKNANLEFHFDNASLSQSLPPTKQALLTMILREAINNVIKHAEATKVSASLSRRDKEIVLTIHDNGKGLTDTSVHLESIEARVALLRGTLEVVNHAGLHMTISIPHGGGLLL